MKDKVWNEYYKGRSVHGGCSVEGGRGMIEMNGPVQVSYSDYCLTK